MMLCVSRTENEKTELDVDSTAPLHMFTCVDHAMHPPLPAAAYCIATNVDKARDLLDQKLARYKLEPSTKKSYTLEQVDCARMHAHTLHLGKYQYNH